MEVGRTARSAAGGHAGQLKEPQPQPDLAVRRRRGRLPHLTPPRLSTLWMARGGMVAHSKIGASLASTSSMTASGTVSSFLPPRAPRSSARG